MDRIDHHFSLFWLGARRGLGWQRPRRAGSEALKPAPSRWEMAGFGGLFGFKLHLNFVW